LTGTVMHAGEILRRGPVMLDAFCTETPLEEIDNPTVFELTRLHLQQKSFL
jgi:hypothetical protein